MKNIFISILLFSILINAASQTHVAGTIDGEHWNLEGSPYILDGDLFVAQLKIDPGVLVMSNGDYVIEVAGIIEAVGAETDPILFTTTDTIEGWQGIFFNVTTFASVMKYCTIEKSINSGIRIINSTPIVQHCLFQNNTATTGAGMYIFNDTEIGAEFKLEGCSFIGNESSSHAGGLYASVEEGNIYLTNTFFEGNVSNPDFRNGNYVGGAVYITNGNLTIDRSEFNENSSNSRCSSTFECTVTARGGALYLDTDGKVEIQNSLFTKNISHGSNGGNCFFGGASRSYGAAIYIQQGNVSILNSILGYNTTVRSGCGARDGGGGVYVNGGDVRISNCVLAYNEDATAVACVGDTVDIENSIIFFNNGELEQISGNCRVSYSCVQDGFEGEGNISNNPIFVKDDSTFHLTSISPCIDNGNPDEIFNDLCFPPSMGTSVNDMGVYGGAMACNWLDEKIVIENDFSINWLEPLQDPVCGTVSEQPITVQIYNHGEYAVSNFEVSYSIDNGMNFVSEKVYESVLPGDSLRYTFKRKADMGDDEEYICLSKVNVLYDVNDTNNVDIKTIQNKLLSVDIFTTDTKCNDATGSAEVLNISGWQAPYELNWTSGDSTMKAENLASDVYFITISDANGCTAVESFSISDQGAPVLSNSTKVNNIDCFGMQNGSIDIIPIGGTAPYSFRWSNGSQEEDVEDLTKGTYDVTITDDDGCASNHSFYVEEPTPLKINAESTDASCGESNGTINLIAGGGTPVYNYQLNGNSVADEITDLRSGLYIAEVIDQKGCTDFTTVSISELDAPQILITSTTPASCGINNGGVNITMADPAKSYLYTWSDGSAGEDLQNVSAGTYTLTVSYEDQSCFTSVVLDIPPRTPSSGDICMVSVDSITEGNTIILKNPDPAEGIVSTNIYLLGSSGSYQLLSTIDPSETNTIVDPGSNSLVTSYRYRIEQEDACGNVSEPSDFHETMHVVAARDYNQERVNLFWNSYKGMEYDFFQILRYSDEYGVENLDSVPRILNKEFYTYTDMNPPEIDSVQYVIAIPVTDGCISFKKNGTHNTVRSNKTKKNNKSGQGGTDIDTYSILHFDFEIYPNPGRGKMQVRIMSDFGNDDVQIRIYNTNGMVIGKKKIQDITGNTIVDLDASAYSPGLYYLQLISKNGLITKSFIVY